MELNTVISEIKGNVGIITLQLVKDDTLNSQKELRSTGKGEAWSGGKAPY